MAQIDKNTVAADNQLEESKRISFEEDGNGIRVLFVGNSITRHAPKESIGWLYDWGMAASEKENDYVHVAKKEILNITPNAAFCVCQAADWEKNYRNGENELEQFVKARDFNADIIVMRLLENCEQKEFDAEIFEEEYGKLINFFNKKQTAKVIISSSFWKRVGDDTLESIAQRNNMDFVYLGDLGEDANMRADGLFEHEGVAAHPGDVGMYTIAMRLFEKIKKYL
ncbi:MAG: hypothetical protein IKW59_02295 [Clostridia bacterium]|nr:hypothetical protein [Clostridia bacterium]